jgi:hypothetical protein
MAEKRAQAKGGKAPALIKFDPDKLKRWRERADRDLYFFQKFLWRDADLDPDFHLPFCRWLEQNYPRRMIAMLRGSFKSSCVRAWMAREGLKTVDWSCLLIEQRFDNARAHLEMMQGKFRWGPTAGLLQDIYADRLDNFDGWRADRLIFKRSDPNALPAVSIAGLDSKLESNHYDHIVCDDLEGADAEKSDAPNEDSEDFVFNRAVPLLKEPEVSGITVVGTSHGPRPLVWVCRDVADEQKVTDPDNPLRWRYWWKPVLNEKGDPAFPARVGWNMIRTLEAQAKKSRKARLLLDKQYFLRRTSSAGGFFDMEAIARNYYRLHEGALLVYPYDEASEDELLDAAGFAIKTERVNHTIDIGHCRTYLHIDPLHKEPEDRISKRESVWAILATAVAPDFHAFVLDYWIEDAGFDEAVRQFFRLYRRYCPLKATLDPVGAQSWIKNHLKALERTTHGNLVSYPAQWRRDPIRLARPSSRIEEVKKGHAEKEPWILEQLEMWFNMGWLHLREDQVELLDHLRNVGTGAGLIDGADALAQAPQVWEPPISPQALAAMKKRKKIIDLMGMIEPITGYVRRFAS